MHSGFIQTLSHFTESILAHSPLRENLEEHDCHRWSRRGCESDSQTEPATAIPCSRNTQDAARASHHSSSQHSSQSLDVVPYKKGLSWYHSTQRVSDSSHHRGNRWRGKGSWGEKVSRHSGKCLWWHTEGTASVKFGDIWDFRAHTKNKRDAEKGKWELSQGTLKPWNQGEHILGKILMLTHTTFLPDHPSSCKAWKSLNLSNSACAIQSPFSLHVTNNVSIPHQQHTPQNTWKAAF